MPNFQQRSNIFSVITTVDNMYEYGTAKTMLCIVKSTSIYVCV